MVDEFGLPSVVSPYNRKWGMLFSHDFLVRKIGGFDVILGA